MIDRDRAERSLALSVWARGGQAPLRAQAIPFTPSRCSLGFPVGAITEEGRQC